MAASKKSLSSVNFNSASPRQNMQRRSRASLLLLRAMHRHALRGGKQLSARTKTMTRKPTIWKRQNLLEGSRKPASAVKRKIRVLRGLVPNSESTGLDELFEKAAEYIVCLQMQVKVMKIMVATPSPSPSPKDSDY